MVIKGWEITFSDVLLLLLTFFVFIISVSVFKTDEYREFWKEYRSRGLEPSSVRGISLIEELNLPRWSPSTEKMLLELEDVFRDGEYQGFSLFYRQNRIKLVIGDEGRFFESGRVSLSPGVIRETLKQLVPRLNRTDFLVNIQGHTDSDPVTARGDNMKLSMERALSTADFLIESGLKKEKVSVSFYGPHRPLASNDSAEGKALNRRVEVNIIINHSKFR